MAVSELWVTRWRKAGIPEEIVERFYTCWGVPPEKVTQAMINDDGRMGLGKLSIPYSPEEVKIHDWETLLHALGYPITSNWETESKFAGHTMERAVGDILYIAAVPVIIVAGTVVASVMWWWRD